MNAFRELNLKEIFGRMEEATDKVDDVLSKEFYKAVYPGKGYDKYVEENEKDLKKIIEDAKNSNDFAECYLILNSKARIFGVFWDNFIGRAASNAVKRRRINNNEFNDFIGLIFIAFDKAIRSFDLKKYTDLKLGNWQYWFGQYLKREAISENIRNMNETPADSIHPDTVSNEDDKGNYWDKIAMTDDAPYEGDFDDNWIKFCNSKEMNSTFTNKIDLKKRDLLADVLRGDRSINMIASDYGVAGNTIRVAMNVGYILDKYGISQEELARNLRDDSDFVLRALSSKSA